MAILGKKFSLMDSTVRSRFHFCIPEEPGWRKLPGRQRRTFFRDSAAIPTLRIIAQALQVQGHQVTDPRPGTACHGAFDVRFRDVTMIVMLLVSRRRGKVEFSLQTWPLQPVPQRWRTRALASPDFPPEWSTLCEKINDIVLLEIRPESLHRMTFREGEYSGTDRRPPRPGRVYDI
jgi:hypothetical protein